MEVAAALTLALLVHASTNIAEIQMLRLESGDLLNSIRKKLMQENYDYTSEELEDGVSVRAADAAPTHSTTVLNTTRKYHLNKQTTRPHRLRLYTSSYVIRLTVKDINESVQKNRTGSNVTEVARGGLPAHASDELTRSGHTPELKTRLTTDDIKYKVLKKKHNFRRNLDTQFIQEESKNGVAILKIGDGPFPVLRLPPSRKQYMHDHADVDSDEEEIPPPSISKSE